MSKQQVRGHKRKWRGNRKMVSRDGPACPRCGKPTEIREHDCVTTKMLRQPFYYSRWYNCVNHSCKTTLIMPKEFMVWTNRGQATKKPLHPESSSNQRSFTDADIALIQDDEDPPF